MVTVSSRIRLASLPEATGGVPGTGGGGVGRAGGGGVVRAGGAVLGVGEEGGADG
ncbi:MAG: hypothetical protein WD646_11545 [Actinomycetota bacterium]